MLPPATENHWRKAPALCPQSSSGFATDRRELSKANPEENNHLLKKP